ncbi:MAG: valine--tRNA ligase [Myxococcales bacterium]|nr:MAG: valine--tRNA ligase [Myxococcales bacterium]
MVSGSVAGYDPKQFEEKWYAAWMERDAFAPKPPAEGEKTFSMVIPPPNVTGSLHMGHALNNALQDILCRYHRMLGEATVWIPGMDHAGIATQNVVEKQLLAEGLDRHALGREAFVERVWRWRETSGGHITEQLKRLGVSCDWSRERFTLDEGLSRAVREVFVQLYEEGLIRRGRYLINWCPRCHTALSDIEVEHDDRDGNLWHLRYPFEDGSGFLTVATTRPETMLGDTAVAVHPDDERYAGLIGKSLVLPVLERVIPLIADTYVDRDFGSGAVKITPGHDPNDYEVGLRHELPMISVLNEDGTMSQEAGEYAGTTRENCRKALVERFEKDGTLVRVDPHRHAVGTCYRCHNVVEPMLSVQWFAEVKGMADRTLEAIDDGRTRFVPAHWEKTYRAWMENIRPWCISRQLWWGHRIPAWYCAPCEKTIVSREDVTECPACAGSIRQDEDVLDTWFSSGLWPFSTQGWPDSDEDLARFYPTSVLVTGFDIIFFWVARMMMLGLRFMDEVPFRDVYIHALVRDEYGQKMSKSKGNVIDPLEIVDEYGADAFRFALAAFAAMGRDIRLSADRIGGYRNFVNKLWNADRYRRLKLEDAGASAAASASCAMPATPRLMPSRWIRSRLAAASGDVREALDGYRFNDAAGRLYQFVWHELCDWYIELSKVTLEGDDADRAETLSTLTAVLEATLRLLHPIMPFVTEELWQGLPTDGRADGFIMHADYPGPEPAWRDDEADAEIGTLIDVVRAARNIRAEMHIAPRVELELQVGEGPARGVVERNEALVARMARLGRVTYATEALAGSAVAVAAGTELAVPVADHVDLSAEATRLRKEIGRSDKEVTRLDKKLGNPSFLEKAPPEVVEEDQAKRDTAARDRETLERSLERVEAIGGAL